MKNVKAIIAIILIFTFGVAAGAIGTHLFYKSRIERFMGGGGEGREEFIVKRLSRSLDLDGQQVEQVRAIMHETHSEMNLIRKQSRPQIEAVMEKGQERIKKILRPAQQEKFEKIIAERKARHHRED